MKAIYVPKGKAKEYGDLACNLYKGCGHGCTYCYAPNVIKMKKEEFFNNPQPRKGIIEAIRKEAKKIGSDFKAHQELSWISSDEKAPKRAEVFLCFTCDPYQPINEEHQLTRQAIEIFHENEMAVNILTKGEITDFDLLAKRPDLSNIGVTLTFAKEYEPGRPITDVAIKNIANACYANIKSWISFEPIIYPQDVLESIEPLFEMGVNIMKFGKWNYDKRANKIDWSSFVNEAIRICEELGQEYYIKEDLREYIERGGLNIF
jgi:DNA repair photolyase